MFNLFSLFRSGAVLVQDWSVEPVSKPCAKYQLIGGRSVIVYKTMEGIWMFDGTFEWLLLGVLPSGTKPAAIIAAADMYWLGYDRAVGDRTCPF